jgi:Flp pilus assembly protein TadD
MNQSIYRYILSASILAMPLPLMAQEEDDSAIEELDRAKNTVAAPTVEVQGAAELRGAMLRIARRPTDSDALIDAGNAALLLGDANAALNFFTRADALQPSNGRIKLGLAIATVRTENPFEALRLFDEAIKLGIPERAVVADRALAFDLLGNFARAQQDYNLAKVSDRSSRLIVQQAISIALLGKEAEADAMLFPLLKQNNGEAWRARAFLLAARGNFSESVKVTQGFMDARSAQQFERYLRQLPQLTAAQKAAAIHLGHFPANNIGRDSETLQRVAANYPTSGATGDGRLVPAGDPFGPKSAAQTKNAAKLSRRERERAAKRAAQEVQVPAAVARSVADVADLGTRIPLPIDIARARILEAEKASLALVATPRPQTVAAPIFPPPAIPPQTFPPAQATGSTAASANNDVFAQPVPVTVTTAPAAPPPSNAVPAKAATNVFGSPAPAITPAPQIPAATVVAPTPQLPAATVITPTPQAPVATVINPSAPQTLPPLVSAPAGNAANPVILANPAATPQASPDQVIAGQSTNIPAPGKAATDSITDTATITSPAKPLDSVAISDPAIVSTPPTQLPRTFPQTLPPTQDSDPAIINHSDGIAPNTGAAPAAPAIIFTPTPQIQTAPTPSPVPAQPAFDLGAVVNSIDIPDDEKKPDVVPVDLKKLPAAAPKTKAAEAVDDKKAKNTAQTVSPDNAARIWVQVATGDASGFQSDMRIFRKKFADLFKGKDSWSSPWSKSSRLLVGPFSDLKEAKKWEADFRKAGGDGFVWRSEKGIEVKPLRAR